MSVLALKVKVLLRPEGVLAGSFTNRVAESSLMNTVSLLTVNSLLYDEGIRALRVVESSVK